MKLPDTFPKQFTVSVVIGMEVLMEASICDWGKILATHLNIAENVAVEQIKDYRLRMRVFRYCGADPGGGFKTDYHCEWVTTDDGTIQFLRMDMLPCGKGALTVHVGLMAGTHEEYTDEEGETFIREIKKD